jgi:competence protein ComEC
MMTPVPQDHHTNDMGYDTVSHYYHRPVIPLLFSLISGILAARYAPINESLLIAWIVAFGCLAYLTFTIVSQKSASVAPLLLFFALGWISITPLLYPGFPPASVLPYLDQGPQKLSGILSAHPVKQGFRTRCVLSNLEVHTKRDPQAPIPLPGKIQLTIYGEAPAINPGDRVSINREIRSIRNFNNPGGFDYRQYMAYENIWGTAWDNPNRLTVTSGGASRSLSSTIMRMRMSIDNAIVSSGSKENRGVLSALIIGNRDRISSELREAFSRSGVSHLLAISGLHVGIIATVTFFLGGAVLGRNTFLLRHAMVKKAAAVISMIFVIGYGLMAGMSPSTQRAVLMICIFLFAFVFDRQYNPGNTLASAALAILAVSPQSLFNISFQLSFAAVTAIFAGLYWWIPLARKNHEETAATRIARIIAGFMWVSILAIIGTMPLVAYYFNQVTFLGIAANIILVPLIGFIVVPLGLFSAIFYLVSESVATFGFSIADALLTGALYIVKGISSFPYGAFRTVTPSILEIACIYMLLVCIPICLLKNRNQLATSGGGIEMPGTGALVSLQRLALVMIGITMLVLIFDTAYWINRRFFNSDLIVTYLDVGQGNAALVEFPEGKTMLVDGGGFGDNASFDVGERIVAPFLWKNKIKKVDKIVLSHPHADHLNGLLYVLENFSVGKIISSHYPADSANYQRFLGIIEDRGIAHPGFSEISRKKNINGVDLVIYHPCSNRGAPSNPNNGSIVLKLAFNGISFLFPGDIESAAEAEVTGRAGSNLHSTFLLSPHHGSSTSSNPVFLDAVNPESIIISARRDRFGLPSEEVINRYNQRGYNVYRTEEHGAIRITVKGERVKIHTEILP